MNEQTWRLLHGDARATLRGLPEASIQCVVTSPPYWGLRDYGVPGQLGLEATPADYVRALVEVFAEVWRVLRPDGVVWCNLGDCYATKDLVGIPWRVALALQADGWYLRSDIIWAKPSCMPEAVKDRPTRSHEYVFLLTKSARYWYDADAICEPYAESTLAQFAAGHYDGAGTKDYAAAGVQNPSDLKARMVKKGAAAAGANARSVWTIQTENSREAHFAVMPKALARKCVLAGCPPGATVLDPFAGVATTGVVALEEGRSFVGIELNDKYLALGRERLQGTMPMFAREADATNADLTLTRESIRAAYDAIHSDGAPPPYTGEW